MTSDQPELKLQALHCGIAAFQQLQSHQKAKVIGKTSRGLFIQFPSQWVIFMTPEIWKGPLTINFSGTLEGLLDISDVIHISKTEDNEIVLSNGGKILVNPASVGKTKAPSGSLLDPNQRVKLIFELINIINTLNPGGVHNWLSVLTLGEPVQFANGNQDLPDILACLEAHIKNFQQKILHQDVNHIIQSSLHYLGRGQGLTPSGDDMISGILLFLNRWGNQLHADLNLNRLSEETQHMIWAQTSDLSASILECAIQGEGDERLVTAIDGIVTGNLSIDSIYSNLTGYGNSSGIDVFLGICAVLIDFNRD